MPHQSLLKWLFLSLVLHTFVGLFWIRPRASQPVPFDVNIGEVKPLGKTTLPQSTQYKIGSESPPPSDSRPSMPNGVSSADPYLSKIQEKIRANLPYPSQLQRRGITGQVTLKVQIAGDGTVVSAQVLKTSGHPELDQLGLKAVEESAPFPQGHEGPSHEGVTLQVPIEFKIH